MMEEHELLGRIQNLEHIVRGIHNPPDRIEEINSLKAELEKVKATAETALARKIPDVSGYMTIKNFEEVNRIVIDTMTTGITDEDKRVRDDLQKKIDRSIGAVHEQVVTAKNAANNFSLFAADLLRQRAMEQAR
jgi:hypothetical protein